MKYIRVIMIFTLSMCMFITHAQYEWNLVKESDGIRVYTRLNENMAFKEFKAIMVVGEPLSSFLEVMYDVEALPEWGHNILEAKMISQDLPDQQMYYAVAKAPWPYKNRAAVYKNDFEWKSTIETLLVKIELIDDYELPNKKWVRMGGYGFWRFERKGKTTEVTFQMQVDPGGSIKAWMANLFTSDSPYKTMLGLKKVVAQEKYNKAGNDFLN